MYLQRVISIKQKKYVFVDVLKVTDEQQAISQRFGSASGSVPKFHGSATLVKSEMWKAENFLT
jgi:hypothetical protein